MGKSPLYFFLFIFFVLASFEVHAATVNTKVTFEGTLTDNASNSIDLRSKTIYFYVYGSQSNCIYYAETSASAGAQDGSINHKIGSGSAIIGSYDASVFTTSTTGYNSSAGACTTVTNEIRNLKVSVPDYSISTSIEITSVPSSLNTELFAGKSLSQFVLATVGTEQSILNVLTSQGTTGQYLTKTTSGITWSSVASPASGLTSVTSANSYLSVTSSTTTPTLTINVGQTSGTVAAGNDSRFSTTLQKTNNLSDLTSSSTARSNLGLGSLATLSTIDLATNVSGTITSSNLPVMGGSFTTGTFGSQSAVPSIAVDIYGRITNVTASAYQYADSINYGILRVPTGANLTLTSGDLTLTASNVINALGYTPATSSQATQWSTSAGLGILYSGSVGIGSEAIDTNYALSISGTTTAFRKIAIGGDQVIYKPDQSVFQGSLFIGDGGSSLTGGGSSGKYNTGIGISSLFSITTGSFNTSIGLNSLTYLTTGGYNTAIGVQSLELATSSANNTAIGYSALRSTTAANNNTAIGYRSIAANSAGQNNTAIGSQSGQSITGTNNTFVGSDSGAHANNTGSYNTFIGKGSGSAITTGSYNTIIGSYDGNDISSLSNYVIISDGNNNRRITIDNSGNMGVGVSSPKATLDISGFAKLQKYSTPPATCSSDTDGSIALTSQYTLCVCKSSSGWVKTSDGSTSCSW